MLSAIRRRTTLSGGAGPTVSVTYGGDAVSGTNNPTYAGCTLRADGTLYKNTNITGAAPNVSYYEDWLDSGSSADVWVSRSITAGDLETDDIGTGRVNCNQQIDLYVEDTDAGASSQNCLLTLNFYDAPTGGNLLESAFMSFTANYTTA